MYIPPIYKEKDKDGAIQFMQRFNFGLLVTTSKNQEPLATHLPFTISEDNDTIIITAHLATANPQWKSFNDHRALVIFSEPHAYISPQFYNKKQNVPTWNYLAVHAYGTINILDTIPDKLKTLETMIDAMEPSYRAQWDSLSEDYKSGMLQGIVAFSMTVTELQFKEKLSQNKKKEEKERIVDAFSKSDSENEQLISKYMAKKIKSKE